MSVEKKTQIFGSNKASKSIFNRASHKKRQSALVSENYRQVARNNRESADLALSSHRRFFLDTNPEEEVLTNS